MEEKSNTKKIVGAIVGLLILLVLAIILLGQGDTYEVKFDSSGGSKVATQKVKSGDKAKKPKDPTKDGYEFVLWENDGVKYDFSEKVTEDITLKATWKEAVKKYKVTFELEGKEETFELEKLDEDVTSYLKFEDREGYEIRWYVGDEEYDFSTPLTGDVKLTGKYVQTSSYTITFDTDGGGKIDSQKVGIGEKAKEPKEPTKRGYIFDGWYYNNNKYDFDAVVKRSMKLVAHWKEDPNVKRFKVTFNSDGGTIVKEQTVMDGDKATKPTNPTKKGFAFVNWELNGTVYNFNLAVKADIELKATWREVVPMKVTFDSDGGTAVPMQEVDEGSKAKEPTPPTKQGYTFVEWRLNGTKYDFNKPVTKDIALKAYWEKIVTYTVTFDADGGTPVPTAQVVVKGKVATKPADPRKDKYTFAEWQLNGKSYNFSTPVTGNITLKAKWEKDKEKYTVRFDANGGSPTPASQTVLEGYKATKPTDPTRSGYVFDGWKLNGNTYNFNTVVSGNITLVASWKKQHKVTFNSNGGSSVAAQTVVDGNKATKPANPTRSGYRFVEWRLQGSSSAYNFSTAVTGDITLVAEWKKQYTVTFNSNGGSSVPTQSVDEGGKATKPSNPTKSGYTFVEWRLQGSTSAYNFSTAVNSNITLVAEWDEVANYTIKFTPVDQISPARKVTVYKNGTAISISSVKYNDGSGDVLCTRGCTGTVDESDVAGERSFKVVLTSGKEVTAQVS